MSRDNTHPQNQSLHPPHPSHPYRPPSPPPPQPRLGQVSEFVVEQSTSEAESTRNLDDDNNNNNDERETLYLCDRTQNLKLNDTNQQQFTATSNNRTARFLSPPDAVNKAGE